jgi:hypothetical protein
MITTALLALPFRLVAMDEAAHAVRLIAGLMARITTLARAKWRQRQRAYHRTD